VPAKKPQKRLGRDFSSLLPGNFDESILLDSKDRVQKLFISNILPDKQQPRKYFDKEALKELSQSIKRHGVLQPLVVSPNGKQFVIVAGEGRHRAAKMAGLKQVPAIIRTSEELERLEIGLVENVQRVDLSSVEQALSIAKLHEQFNVPYTDIAKRLGKAETTIVNTVRLLQLPEDARRALEKSQITEGHARAILALRGLKDQQKRLLKDIVTKGLSVRQAERFASNAKLSKGKNKPKRSQDTQTHKNLSDKLGAKVTIVKTAKGGRLQIEFGSEAQLEKIINSLS
jgi:ParB family chromosome partitioning protein